MGDHKNRLIALLRHMVEIGASDLHLAAGAVPQARVHGQLIDVSDENPLDENELHGMMYSVLAPELQRQFEEEWELDFSMELEFSRFRGNLMKNRGRMGAVLRVIPMNPLSLEELGLPPVVRELTKRSRGLILVCGPSGSGKSTTLAAMIDAINQTRRQTIVTIEDPIEFVHPNKSCLVRQRQLGADTRSFAGALKHVMRQDPDIIMVGEMRDLETIALTLTAAETGHLALGTLHTLSTAAAIDRIIDVFPPHQQNQVRLQLSMALVGIISQTLIPRADGAGRALAVEVLIGSWAIRNLIREGKTHQITSMLHQGASMGMTTMESSLKRLLDQGTITIEEATAQANDPQELKRLIEYQQSQVMLRK